MPLNEAPLKKGRGDFFTVDRRTWAALCDFGDVKQAVTYLAIAQGTLKGGRISSWSAKSIETHLGLHSTRAKNIIANLIELGFLCRDQAPHSTHNRPRYIVPPFHEVFASTLPNRIAVLNSIKRYLMDMVIREGDKGWAPSSRSRSSNKDIEELRRLAHDGLVREENKRWYLAAPNSKPELIWLPNAIVQGTNSGESSPLRELRRANDIWALRLFVDLYQSQN